MRLRSTGGWTQVVVSERAGITEQYLRRVERGSENPSLATLIALAGAMGTSASQLVREVEVAQTDKDAGRRRRQERACRRFDTGLTVCRALRDVVLVPERPF